MGVSDPPRLWMGSIVVECREFRKMIDFWSAALGYVAREPASSDWAIITDPRGVGPNISFQKGTERAPADYRYHFDLYSNDPQGEIDRLLDLGATIVLPLQPDRDFVTLSDPDGNPFDVVETHSFVFGQRSLAVNPRFSEGE